MYDLTTKQIHDLSKHHNQDHAKMDSKFSPDGHLVSYVSNNDLYVQNVKNGTVHRLTTSGENCTSGVAEFIMQEEFERYTGYWWDPSKSKQTYRIAYLEVDENQVTEIHIPSGGIEPKVDTYRYPRAGSPNAKSTLCVVEFDLAFTSVKMRRYDLLESFPWFEYVMRCGWTPDGLVWLNLLDRKQQHSALITVNPENGFTRTVLEERSSIWINAKDTIYFIRDGCLLYGNETITGYNHLYLYTAHDTTSQYRVSKTITCGNWQVDFPACNLWVDEQRSLVYFYGTKDTPLESHIYYASFASAGDVTRITELGSTHTSVEFNQKRTRMICTRSNVDTPPECLIYSLVENQWNRLFRVEYSFKPTNVPFPLARPNIFSFINSNNDELFGCYYLPPDYDARVSYPMILYIYGGPKVQLVSRNYQAYANGRLQLITSLGYVVVSIDGRGSSKRGLMFEGNLRNRMGQFEVLDQIEGIEYLIKNEINIDRTRVGVFGWSYGGYLALMALAQFGHFFKICIAGAPVTSWELYDTGYTERYMDLPESNPHGYETGSVLHYVSQLPDDGEDRLLILCGMMDENVHLTHSTSLIDAMVNYGKSYSISLYPNERHGIRAHTSIVHYQMRMIQFMLKNLRVN